MIQFLGLDCDSRIAHIVNLDAPDIGPPPPTPADFGGFTYVPWAQPFPLTPPTPTQVAFYLDGRPQWVETATLEQAQAAAWTAAKVDRDKAEAAPFEFEGGLYDPNKENVTGAAFVAYMAQAVGQSISRRWTLADNSRRDLNGTQLIAMGLALTTRVDAIHERGRMLRDLINNATTPAEAYGYTWNSLDA